MRVNHLSRQVAAICALLSPLETHGLLTILYAVYLLEMHTAINCAHKKFGLFAASLTFHTKYSAKQQKLGCWLANCGEDKFKYHWCGHGQLSKYAIFSTDD